MKKGFILAETITVIVIITVGLMSIYSLFYTIISEEKRRSEYNMTEDLYKTFYLKNFFLKNNLSSYYHDFDNQNTYYSEIDCFNVEDYGNTTNNNKAFCEKLFDEYNVYKIYLMNYDTSVYKGEQNVADTLDNFDINVTDYIRTLDSGDEGYRFVVVFAKTKSNGEKTGSDRIASIKVQAGNSSIEGSIEGSELFCDVTITECVNCTVSLEAQSVACNSQEIAEFDIKPDDGYSLRSANCNNSISPIIDINNNLVTIKNVSRNTECSIVASR